MNELISSERISIVWSIAAPIIAEFLGVSSVLKAGNAGLPQLTSLPAMVALLQQYLLVGDHEQVILDTDVLQYVLVQHL